MILYVRNKENCRTLCIYVLHGARGVPLAERRGGSAISNASMNKTASPTSADSSLDLPIFFIIRIERVPHIYSAYVQIPSTVFFYVVKFYKSGNNEVARHSVYSERIAKIVLFMSQIE